MEREGWKGDGVIGSLSVRSMSPGGVLVEESISGFFHDSSDPLKRQAPKKADVSDHQTF